MGKNENTEKYSIKLNDVSLQEAIQINRNDVKENLNVYAILGFFFFLKNRAFIFP